MNYQKIHDQIIERAKSRKLDGYKERHHIIPKCMGGTNDNTNLIELTAREHFIIHKLLCEIYPDNDSLVYAYWMMANNTSNAMYERKYYVSGKDYERAKCLFAERSSKRQKGKPLTDEHKRALSIAAKIRKPRTPIKHSEETKQKLSKLWKDTIRSKEDRKKISDGQRGKKKGPYTITKYPLPVTCPHCGKTGSPRGTKRWHFDNCKHLKLN